jgi:hypothetical protein
VSTGELAFRNAPDSGHAIGGGSRCPFVIVRSVTAAKADIRLHMFDVRVVP